jgi:aubergine-like protein
MTFTVCCLEIKKRQHYGITIEDLDQPLLLNRPKSKVKNAAQKDKDNVTAESEVICLIPELCSLTGLTDDIRKDFRIMKELANHTRVAPTQRYESLKMFVENIRNTPRALRHLTNWGLELDEDTVVVSVQVVPSWRNPKIGHHWSIFYDCD